MPTADAVITNGSYTGREHSHFTAGSKQTRHVMQDQRGPNRIDRKDLRHGTRINRRERFFRRAEDTNRHDDQIKMPVQSAKCAIHRCGIGHIKSIVAP